MTAATCANAQLSLFSPAELVETENIHFEYRRRCGLLAAVLHQLAEGNKVAHIIRFGDLLMTHEPETWGIQREKAELWLATAGYTMAFKQRIMPREWWRIWPIPRKLIEWAEVRRA